MLLRIPYFRPHRKPVFVRCSWIFILRYFGHRPLSFQDVVNNHRIENLILSIENPQFRHRSYQPIINLLNSSLVYASIHPGPDNHHCLNDKRKQIGFALICKVVFNSWIISRYSWPIQDSQSLLLHIIYCSCVSGVYFYRDQDCFDSGRKPTGGSFHALRICVLLN